MGLTGSKCKTKITLFKKVIFWWARRDSNPQSLRN
jgi:hypothetical protein